jgi:hypothetical protein
MKILILISTVLLLSCAEHYNVTGWADRNLGIYITDTLVILPQGKWDVNFNEGMVTLTDTLNLIQIHYALGLMDQKIIDTCFGQRVLAHDSLIPNQFIWKKK